MSRAAPTKSPGVSALQPPLPLSTWTSEFGVALLQEILLAHGPPKAAEWSLFAPDDPVLRRAQRGRAPYAKHLLQRTADGKFTFQPTQKGWTVGRKAAESGLEYRAFFEPGAESRRTFGAVRFSSSARADEDGFNDDALTQEELQFINSDNIDRTTQQKNAVPGKVAAPVTGIVHVKIEKQ